MMSLVGINKLIHIKMLVEQETAEMWSFCYGDRMLKLDEKKIRKGKPIGNRKAG